MTESILLALLICTLALQTCALPMIRPDDPELMHVTAVITPFFVLTGLLGAIFGLTGAAIRTSLSIFTGNKLIESYWREKSKYDKAKWEADYRYAQLVQAARAEAQRNSHGRNETKQSIEQVD